MSRMHSKGRDKCGNADKHARAGPGTGSMGGKCSVCGDRATKFRYSLYSTTSCFSCRAFFRRSLVGNKFETFSCRSIGDTRSCQVTAANRKKCQACRFAKCRQMGMTHTNLDTKTPSSTSTVSHHKPSSGHHLSVKHPSVTLSPIMEEPTDYSSDCYDYESQGYMDKNDYCYTAPVTVNSDNREPMFSYRVLPVDGYPEDYSYMSMERDPGPPPIIISPAVSNDTMDSGNGAYMIPVTETFPVDNFTVYQDPADHGEHGAGELSPGRHHHTGVSGDLSRHHYGEDHGEEYYMPPTRPPLYEYEMPLALDTLDTGVEPAIPPIRYLYADDCNDDTSIQLQIADHQSGLGWGDVVRIVDPFIRLPGQPIDIVEHVTTLILMEEQVNETLFKSIKHIIWSKISRFIQAIPSITSQLSQGELSCLWEHNKDSMMLFFLGELFSTRFSSLHEQICSVKLILFTEEQSASGLSLAPPVNIHFFRNIFNMLWNDQKNLEIRKCLDLISSYPTERTVSNFLLVLIFLSLDRDKTDLYQPEEPFMQKVRGFRQNIEQALKMHLCSLGHTEDSHWKICKFKLETLANVQNL